MLFLFSLFFVHSLYIYILLLYFMSSLLSLLVQNILLVEIKELRVKTHFIRTTLLEPRVRSARRGPHQIDTLV